MSVSRGGELRIDSAMQFATALTKVWSDNNYDFIVVACGWFTMVI